MSGKDDLLLVLLEREIARIADRIVAATAKGKDVIGRLRRGAREWITLLDEEPDLLVLLIEFWTNLVRSSKHRSKHAKRLSGVRQAIGGMIEDQARTAGLITDLPAEHVGAVVLALADGLAIQRLADRKAIPDELLPNALEMHTRSLTARATH